MDMLWIKIFTEPKHTNTTLLIPFYSELFVVKYMLYASFAAKFILLFNYWVILPFVANDQNIIFYF